MVLFNGLSVFLEVFFCLDEEYIIVLFFFVLFLLMLVEELNFEMVFGQIERCGFGNGCKVVFIFNIFVFIDYFNVGCNIQNVFDGGIVYLGTESIVFGFGFNGG